MRRREFIGLAAGAAVLRPPGARAQQPALRVCVIATSSRSSFQWIAFLKRMEELGYREGQNFVLDFLKTPGPGDYEAGFRYLKELKPDVIVTSGAEASLKFAIAASETTPVVMLAIDFDPLERGFVANLARPGGRITGLFQRLIELTGKRLQFLKEAFPSMRQSTVFWDAASKDQWEAAQQAGAQFGVRLAGVDLGAPPYDYERALNQAPDDYRKSLFMPTSPSLLADRNRLVEFALRKRMASMFVFREYVEAGGLASYGPSLTGMFSHIADYVDRIGRGANPAELPVEQPTKFEFAVNLATARSLGIELPPTLLAAASEVIE